MTTRLEVVWQKSDGEYGVWEIEHLFGHELAFGRICDGRYMPVRWIALVRALTPWERHRATIALCCWTAGDWTRLQLLLSDLAAGG